MKVTREQKLVSVLLDCRIENEGTGSPCMDSTMHIQQGRQLGSVQLITQVVQHYKLNKTYYVVFVEKRKKTIYSFIY